MLSKLQLREQEVNTLTSNIQNLQSELNQEIAKNTDLNQQVTKFKDNQKDIIKYQKEKLDCVLNSKQFSAPKLFKTKF